MKDILKKYRKYKLISNIGIVASSLIVAIGINVFVIDSTNIGKNLKTSVLNSNASINLADIYLEKSNNLIQLKTSNNINNATALSFSISYNPDALDIKNILSSNAQVLNLSNTPGINSVVITFSEKTNIKSGDAIANIELDKLKEGIQNINIINAKFTNDVEEDYLLTTSGISF